MYIISQTTHYSDKGQCIVSDAWSSNNGQPNAITYRSPSNIDLFLTYHPCLHNKPKDKVHPGHKLTSPKHEEEKKKKKKKKKEKKKKKKKIKEGEENEKEKRRRKRKEKEEEK
jgi:hypothetical protein